MEVNNKEAKGIPWPTDNILILYIEILFMNIMGKICILDRYIKTSSFVM